MLHILSSCTQANVRSVCTERERREGECMDAALGALAAEKRVIRRRCEVWSWGTLGEIWGYRRPAGYRPQKGAGRLGGAPNEQEKGDFHRQLSLT